MINQQTITIDDRLLASCIELGDWPLSRVFLKDEQDYPWFVLVPRKVAIQEIYQLEHDEQVLLMEEINQLSLLIKEYFSVDKLNIGALGNVVSQLHIHVVARTHTDPLWPQGIWQAAMQSNPYKEEQLQHLIPIWREKIACKQIKYRR